MSPFASGTWSDDGAQALCLLESLLACGALYLDDFAARMTRWYSHGHLAVDGHVFDIGVTTAAALRKLLEGASAESSGSAGPYSNGNGSLMRVLPLALWHLGDDSALVADARRHRCRPLAICARSCAARSIACGRAACSQGTPIPGTMPFGPCVRSLPTSRPPPRGTRIPYPPR